MRKLDILKGSLPFSNAERANLWIPHTELNEYGSFTPCYSFLLREEIFKLGEVPVDDRISNDALLDMGEMLGIENLIIADACPVTGYDATKAMILQLFPNVIARRLVAIKQPKVLISFSECAGYNRLRLNDIIANKGSWLVMPTFIGSTTTLKPGKEYKIRQKIAEYIGDRQGELNIVFPDKPFSANKCYCDLVNLLIENGLSRTGYSSVRLHNPPLNLVVNNYITNRENTTDLVIKRKPHV